MLAAASALFTWSAPAVAQCADPTLAKVLSGEQRPARDTERDVWRHPAETLAFFGVDPKGAIGEIDPLGGYYARILIPWVAANGGAYTAVTGPVDEEDRDLKSGLEKLAVESGGKLTVQWGELSAKSAGIAPAGSLDAVVTFRNVHNWMGDGFAEKAFKDFYAALKPGGVLGLVEHRMPESSPRPEDGRTGYVRQSYVVKLAQDAGFVLEASSEINANPKDDADHLVWWLKPTRGSPRPGTPEAAGFDRAAYDAIGESDRMTLRFRKPAS